MKHSDNHISNIFVQLPWEHYSLLLWGEIPTMNKFVSVFAYTSIQGKCQIKVIYTFPFMYRKFLLPQSVSHWFLILSSGVVNDKSIVYTFDKHFSPSINRYNKCLESSKRMENIKLHLEICHRILNLQILESCPRKNDPHFWDNRWENIVSPRRYNFSKSASFQHLKFERCTAPWNLEW